MNEETEHETARKISVQPEQKKTENVKTVKKSIKEKCAQFSSGYVSWQ